MEIIQRLLDTIVPIVFIVSVGFAYAKYKNPDMSGANRLNMDLFVPILIFAAFSDASFNILDYWQLALGAAIVILGSGLLAWPVGRLLGYDARTFLPPLMYTNTGNLGLPLILLAFGEAAVPAAVVVFAVEMVLHFTVGFYQLDRHAKVINEISVPTLIAVVAALTLNLLAVPMPPMIGTGIDLLADICIPLMLFALGVRMATVTLTDLPISLWSSVLTPATGLILVFALQPFLQLDPIQFSVFVVFGALPPAVLNYLVAERYNQEPAKVASIVLISNLASVVIIPMALLLTPDFQF